MIKGSYKWGGNNQTMVLEDHSISIKKEIIAPNSGEKWHFHKHTHQWFLWKQGDLILQTTEGEYNLFQETCFEVPPLKAHKIWNTGSTFAEFYLISKSASIDDKHFMEFSFPDPSELKLDVNNYVIRLLSDQDTPQFSSVLKSNELRLRSSFPTIFDMLSGSNEHLIHLLKSTLIIPFGLFHGGSMVGYISLKEINRLKYSCELAYWISDKYEGLGIMKHMLERFIQELTLNFGFRYLTARIEPDNIRSINMAKKLGFVETESVGDILQFKLTSKLFLRQTNQIKIYRHRPELSKHFKSLNESWINELFEIEEADNKILNHPDTEVIQRGGQIFYIELQGKIVSTGAILPLPTGEFELTKMATSLQYQGLGFGDLIISQAIRWCKEKDIPSLILYSQSTLFKALKLYEKHGFVYEKFDSTLYKRADVKMRLVLSP